MTDDNIQAFKGDFSLLIEAGFVAAKQLDETSAVRIFNAAQVISPDSTAPQVGLGYIALNKLETKEAIKIFGEVVKKEPDNYLAQTFLGMCYLLTKSMRKKGEKLILDAMGKTTSPTVRSLGEISLEWAESDLQKKEVPFFAGKQEKSEGTGEE